MHGKMKFGISQKMLLAPVLVLLLLVTVGGVSYFSIRNVLGDLDTMARSDSLAQGAQQIETDVVRQSNNLRAYVLSQKEADYTTFKDTGKRLTADLERLIGIAADESTRQQFQQIKTDEAAYLDVVDRAAPLISSGKSAEADSVLKLQGTPLATRMADTASALVTQSSKTAADGVVAAKASAARIELIIILVAVIAVVIGILVALRISRSLARPIQKLAMAATQLSTGDLRTEALAVTSGDEVGETTRAFNDMAKNLREVLQQVSRSTQAIMSSSEQLSAASQSAAQAATGSAQAIGQVAGGANEQASRTAQANSTVEQLQDAIQQIAQGAGKSAAEVQDAATLLNQMATHLEEMVSHASDTAGRTAKAVQRAHDGAEVVNSTLREIEQIGVAVAKSADRITELERLSGQIGAITEVISGIAEQTNLLALNAAIEAARAGEHGRGFAVVADEVRKLAERSAASTTEITDLIRNIQASTAEAVKAMDQGTERVAAGNHLASEAGQALQEILATLQSAAAEVENIAESAAHVKEDSTKAMHTFNDVAAVTEENTAATEEMAAGAAEVTRAIEQISLISQENAAAAEEVSASVEELTASSEQVASSAQSLAKTAQELQEQVQRFVL